MTTDTATPHTRTLDIDVWLDVICPFCYIGDAELARALEQFPHRDAVTIRYHSYQLMPELPHDHPVDLNELLANRRGVSRAQADTMNDSVAQRGRTLGLDYRFDLAQTINTRTAHRLIQHAGIVGHQHDLVTRLFRAYFTDGLNVADHNTLADLAAQVGLDRQAALDALTDDALDQRIDQDIAQAQQIGVQGVPFFVLDGRYGVSGAQQREAFQQALDQAWAGENGR